ncbi:MAG: DUF116 domain-containing protein [bacterium]
MRDHPTYSLTSTNTNSELYYRRVREFTDEVLDHASESLLPAVRDFMDYLRINRLENLRRSEEYFLELLSFRLLWNSYGGYALAVRRAPFVLLARRSEWRKRHQPWKPMIDQIRGILMTLFLYPQRGEQRPSSLPTLYDVDWLCLWLEATGEFSEQALRFVRWRGFWATQSAASRAEFGAAAFRFTTWFSKRSEEVLGEYTTSVDAFLLNTRHHYRWLEDRVQCTRRKIEYHLNMLGAEIMNRAFRNDFNSTETKAVLLPGCMRSRSDKECKAIRTLEGLRCEDCLPQCSVNRIREMGKKQHFEVYLIPHASDFSLWSPKPGNPRRGVVAAACVTTLVEGGWELKRYDVPAQCVLLDYSGCKKHWDCEGTPTALNIRELKRILVNAGLS